MDKRTYYVSVEAGKVAQIKDNETFEFEILATPEEADHIRSQFIQQNNADTKEFIHAHVPIPSVLKKDQEEYDDALIEVYRQIYLLGTPETQSQIESLHLFDR